MQVVSSDSAGLQALGARWTASAGELDASMAPMASGLSFQASTAAVSVAHADVEAFVTTLAMRVRNRATRVIAADGRYTRNEADSAGEMAAVTHPSVVV
ncbi:hypothetical protein ACRU3B_17910 [Mycobacterium colombiense]|uniref:hypothetical protein n=1 Tax=Mycobacterium colombiense TaxID=339268 RepID=UPI00097D2E68|nr:hypothetical protein [Mycobacterium colombiense]